MRVMGGETENVDEWVVVVDAEVVWLSERSLVNDAVVDVDCDAVRVIDWDNENEDVELTVELIDADCVAEMEVDCVGSSEIVCERVLLALALVEKLILTVALTESESDADGDSLVVVVSLNESVHESESVEDGVPDKLNDVLEESEAVSSRVVE